MVFLDHGPAPASAAELTIRLGATGARLSPGRIATGAGAELSIRNRTSTPHTVSCPELGLLKRVLPGSDTTVRLDTPGSDVCFLLEQDSGEATLFVSPGPFSVVSETGRFKLVDLPPGSQRLHAWHPRFPPVVRDISLQADQVLRLDLEMGVGQRGAE